MGLALDILPLILTLAAGWAMMASRLLPKDQWHGIEVLSFRVLIPIVLIQAIAGAELSVGQFGNFALALLGSLFLMAAVVLALRGIFSKEALPNPSFTTLFQTSTRWNGFIALAAAELMIGEAGLILIAVAFAVLIPVINVVNIVVLAAFGPGKASIGGVTLIIAKNPLVQGCLIGLAINLSGLSVPRPVEGTMDLIGRAALGVGLLAVGAGISLRRLIHPTSRIIAGVFLRLCLGPVVFMLLATLLGLTPVQTLSGVFVLAVPAATNGYIVAKQMGGDAELYADILTWQTILSLGLLPVLAVFLAV